MWGFWGFNGMVHWVGLSTNLPVMSPFFSPALVSWLNHQDDPHHIYHISVAISLRFFPVFVANIHEYPNQKLEHMAFDILATRIEHLCPVWVQSMHVSNLIFLSLLCYRWDWWTIRAGSTTWMIDDWWWLQKPALWHGYWTNLYLLHNYSYHN